MHFKFPIFYLQISIYINYGAIVSCIKGRELNIQSIRTILMLKLKFEKLLVKQIMCMSIYDAILLYETADMQLRFESSVIPSRLELNELECLLRIWM